MYTVENRYIPYLQEGYAEETVQPLLADMKIYTSEGHEKIYLKALEIFNDQNDAIRERNSQRSFVVKLLDTLLWALSFGCIHLLEREINTDEWMEVANKIHDFVLNTPIIEQTGRHDYAEALAKIKQEEEQKKQAQEKLQQELKQKEEEQKQAEAKLEQELKLQEAAKKEAGDQAKGVSEEKQAELKAAAEKVRKEFEAKQAALQKEIFEREEEAKRIRKELKGYSGTDEERKVKALKAAWLDDAPSELNRLKGKQLLSAAALDAVGKVTHSYNYYGYNHLAPNTKADQAKMIVGRALEIKQFYSNTHYVFTHGQGKGLFVINECMHRLLQMFTPSLHNPLSMPFRLPFTVDLTENVEEFFKKYPNVTSHSFSDDQLNETTGELLSVDTYMWNTQGYESALYFFGSGSNINMSDPTIGLKIFKSIFINYLKDNFLCEAVAKKAAALAADHAKANQLGTLWTICIPKTVVENPAKNMAYRSHAFGRKCTCHSASQDIDVLRRTQRDEAVLCSGGLHPQYRLLTARLVQEPGVRSFPLNGLKKVENKGFSSRIKILMRELALYSKIVGLTSTPSKEESDALNKELQALCEKNQIEAECLEHLLATKYDVLTEELRDTLGLAIATLVPEIPEDLQDYD